MNPQEVIEWIESTHQGYANLTIAISAILRATESIPGAMEPEIRAQFQEVLEQHGYKRNE